MYGSLLAFRQADLRGIIAYSSLRQMGLVTLGIFSNNIVGGSGASPPRSFDLVSAALFLLAGMVEQRTGTDDVAALGGMAKGRPALATIVLLAGMFALAVPGSGNFASAFLLAGVFDQGWGYAAVGAAAIVFAANVRAAAISAILHGRRGPAVPEGARDLRPPSWPSSSRSSPGLLALSPAGGRERPAPSLRAASLADLGGRARDRHADRRLARARPRSRSWRGWALPARRRAGAETRAQALRGRRLRRGLHHRRRARGSRVRPVARSGVADRRLDGPRPLRLLRPARDLRRRRTGCSLGRRPPEPRRRVLPRCSRWRAPGCCSSCRRRACTLFLGLSGFSIALYVLCALDTHRERSQEAGLKYLIVGSFGSSILLFGAALVYEATGSSASRRSATHPAPTIRCSWSGWR